MRIKNRWLLAAVFFMAVLLAVLILAAPVGAVADYTRPGSDAPVTHTAADLLEWVLSAPIGEAERAYLDACGTVTLSYDDRISTSYVETVYDVSTGEALVIASPYTYVTEAGIEVVWLPVSMTVGNDTVTPQKSSAGWEGRFSSVQGAEISVLVTYRASFSIPGEDIAALCNFAYNEAVFHTADIAARAEEYERLRTQYLSDVASYEAYLAALSEYESDMVLYRNYLTLLRDYEERRALYEEYLDDMAVYEENNRLYEAYREALAEYNSAYAAYQDYLARLSAYEQEYAVYQQYLDTLDDIRAQLSALDLVRLPMTDGRTVYDAVMGSTVTSVLENKDLLTGNMVGADAATIDIAGEATENLRTLMREYFALTDEAERYAYYTVNYEALRDNFSDLLGALDKLYRYKKVRAILIDEGKDKKYIILVAQLHLVANALSDGPVLSLDGSYRFDSSWTIEKQTARAILENKNYYTDTDSATPYDSGYPAPMEAPTPPAAVVEPVPPAAVAKPVMPDPVAAPGDPPAAVSEPTPPDPVPEPGEPPVPYEPSAEVQALLAAYGRGEIQPRPYEGGDRVYVAQTSVSKRIYPSSDVHVAFYADDRETLLYRTTVDAGTYVEYRGGPVVREEDEAAVYTHSGWVNSAGEPVSLSSVSEDCFLYPSFTASYKSYPITWDIDGTSYTTEAVWGTLPVCPVTPEKPYFGSYYYLFRGFSPDPVPVTGAATYTAEFEARYAVPFSDGGAYIYREGDVCYVDVTATVDRVYDLSRLLPRIGEECSVCLIVRQGTLTFSRADVQTMRESGVSVAFTATQRLDGGIRYELAVTEEGGEVLPVSATYRGTPGFAEPSCVRLSVPGEEGGRVYRTFSYREGVYSFAVQAGVPYTLGMEYPVNIIAPQNATLTVGTDSAPVGERVSVSVEVSVGFRVEKLYVVDTANREISLTDGSFAMPEGGVSVGCVIAPIPYTVTFVSDGKVISRQTLYYGDLPNPPTDPKKATDTRFAYIFEGWSPQILSVSGDAVYTAVYTADPLPEREQPRFAVSRRVLQLLVLAGVALLLLVAGVIPGGVFAFFRVRAYRRTRLPVAGRKARGCSAERPPDADPPPAAQK